MSFNHAVDKAEKKWSIKPTYNELHPVMEAFFKHDFNLVVDLVNMRLKKGFVEQANALRIMKALALVYLGREKEVVDTMCGIWIPYQRKSLLQGDRYYTVAPQLRGVLPRRFLYLLDAAIVSVAELPSGKDYDPKLDSHGPGYWRPSSSVPLRPVPKRVRRRLKRANKRKPKSTKELLATAHPWSFWGVLPYHVAAPDGLSPHFRVPRVGPVEPEPEPEPVPVADGPASPFWYGRDEAEDSNEIANARQRAYERIAARRRTILAPARASVARAKYLSGRTRDVLGDRSDDFVGVPRVGKLLAMPWLDGGGGGSVYGAPVDPSQLMQLPRALTAYHDEAGYPIDAYDDEEDEHDDEDYDSEVDDIDNPVFSVSYYEGGDDDYDDGDDGGSSGVYSGYKFALDAHREAWGADTEAASVDDDLRRSALVA